MSQLLTLMKMFKDTFYSKIFQQQQTFHAQLVNKHGNLAFGLFWHLVIENDVGYRYGKIR